MKRLALIAVLLVLSGMALAFDFSMVETKFDPKGKVSNLSMDYEGAIVNIYGIPQTKDKVPDDQVLTFTFGMGATKKYPEKVPGTPVFWFGCNQGWIIPKTPSVTVNFEKVSNINYDKTYSAWFLEGDKWVSGGNVRVDKTDHTISFFMQRLGNYAITCK